MPKHPKLDNEKLKEKFKQMQKVFHPDLNKTREKGQQTVSASNASLINRGYRILSNPVERVKHLLYINSGLECPDETVVPSDTSLLMRVYEAREMLSNCASIEEGKSILETNERNLAAEIEKVSDEFAKKNIEGLKRSLAVLQFYEKLVSESKEVCHHLENKGLKAKN
eukprot:CAMPEP_0171452084 /NCGR_PEP_ID=MMETSP0945-20130129/327_1 /TAXON_ID=109269 /ORGANISM="Vaucheria litorea, Strain CCMP2940" /LENGTH=167 /DNA_ID=CAMNT_0011976667 /DNA_START=237 /DNA_END=740 /DNA_ORIENTATION=-